MDRDVSVGCLKSWISSLEYCVAVFDDNSYDILQCFGTKSTVCWYCEDSRGLRCDVQRGVRVICDCVMSLFIFLVGNVCLVVGVGLDVLLSIGDAPWIVCQNVFPFKDFWEIDIYSSVLLQKKTYKLCQKVGIWIGGHVHGY